MSHPRALSHIGNTLKWWFLLIFLRGAGIALTLGVLVCAQAGCLIPQAIDQKVPVAGAPPHFVAENIPDNLLVPILTLRRQGTTDAAQTPPCHCNLEFSGISVDEEDATITLTAKWFVDYDPANQASVRSWQEETLLGTFNDPTLTRRQLSNVFRLDADAMSIVTSGAHVVELVVGESTGFDPFSTTQPNRAMRDGWVSAVYKWVVDVHLEQVTGQCATAPPAKQVCG
jgi:hypothetical protein